MRKKLFRKTKVFRFRMFERKSYSAFNSIHKVVTIGVLFGLALTSAHASSLKGSYTATPEATPRDTTAAEELDEVSVVVEQSMVALQAISASIIECEQLRQKPIKSIQDLLHHTSTIDVMQRSPHGVQADISIRGSSFDQTAILINGINLSNPQTGHHNLNLPINLSDIERIEVLEGTASILHNSEALAGGINIITKQRKESSIYGKAEGGMFGLLGGEIRGEYSNKRNFTTSLSVGYGRSSGYIKNSDYQMLNALLQSKLWIKNKADVALQVGYNKKNFGANTFYAPTYPNQYEKTNSLFTTLKGETYGRLKFSPKLYWSRHYDEFQLIREGTPDIPTWYKDHNYHISNVFGSTLGMEYYWRHGVIAVGADLRNESILSSVLGEPMKEAMGKYTNYYNRTNASYSLESRFLWRGISAKMGLLVNTNTSNSDKINLLPAASFTYTPKEHSTISLAWHMAGRLPTFTELYYSTKTHAGNRDLTQEKTHLAELSYNFRNSYLRLNSSVFYTHAFSVIDWQLNQDDEKWHSSNLPADKPLKTLGANISATLDLEELIEANQPITSIGIGYQHLFRNSDGFSEKNPISMYVFNYLRNKFTANINHKIARGLTASWSMRVQDRAGNYMKYSDEQPPAVTAYKPFFILDLRCNYNVKGFDVFLDINNLTNTTYNDFGTIPQPGIWVTGGVSYALK